MALREGSGTSLVQSQKSSADTLRDSGYWADAVGAPLVDMFEGETVSSPNQQYYGGSPGYAQQEAEAYKAIAGQQLANAPATAGYWNTLGQQQQGMYQGMGAQQQGQFSNLGSMALGSANQYGAYSEADRRRIEQNLASLRQYYQQGPGESAAQAQLRMGSENAMAQQLAMARSGRGAGESAANLQQAAAQNATIQAQTNQQAALLRAQEADAWRGRQLQAMSQEQQGRAGLLQSDIGRQMGYQQLGQQMYGQGAETALGYGQLGAQTNLGYTNAGITSQGQYLGSAGQYAGLAQQPSQSQLSANTDIARAQMEASSKNAELDAQRDSSVTGMLAGALGIFSDIRGKENISWAVPENQNVEDSKRRRMEDLMSNSAPSGGNNMLSGMGGGMLSGMLSDKRAKELSEELAAIKKDAVYDADQDRWVPNEKTEMVYDVDTDRWEPRQADMTGSPGYFYDYKDQSNGVGRQYGPMAQDLAQQPSTAHTVQRRPDGYLGVDTNKLTMANTGAISEMQNELDQLKRVSDAREALGKIDYPGDINNPWAQPNPYALNDIRDPWVTSDQESKEKIAALKAQRDKWEMAARREAVRSNMGSVGGRYQMPSSAYMSTQSGIRHPNPPTQQQTAVWVNRQLTPQVQYPVDTRLARR